MADISTVEEGVAAASIAGADFIATTLSGYTDYSPQVEGPDFKLVKALKETSLIPLSWQKDASLHPRKPVKMIDAGAFAVTVGSAITRPRSITQRYIKRSKDNLWMRYLVPSTSAGTRSLWVW
jgi:N-acylglucosamine-6-phosphate 2-epimerase